MYKMGVVSWCIYMYAQSSSRVFTYCMSSLSYALLCGFILFPYKAHSGSYEKLSDNYPELATVFLISQATILLGLGEVM
jgi:ATP/ADP translocase